MINSSGQNQTFALLIENLGTNSTKGLLDECSGDFGGARIH
jgi:hypothetical protein